MILPGENNERGKETDWLKKTRKCLRESAWRKRTRETVCIFINQRQRWNILRNEILASLVRFSLLLELGAKQSLGLRLCVILLPLLPPRLCLCAIPLHCQKFHLSASAICPSYRNKQLICLCHPRDERSHISSPLFRVSLALKLQTFLQQSVLGGNIYR